jgi:hypothetical protein
MPAGLPGSTRFDNVSGNPSAGAFVIFCPLSGPKGSPLDDQRAGSVASVHASTGGLSTGIGFGSLPIIEIEASDPPGTTAALAIERAGFIDNQQPGTISINTGTPNTVNSTMMYIGGGKCTKAVQGIAPAVPYTAGISICGAGNGGSRDGPAGPAFKGFPVKMVTATGSVANGVDIEAGWTNRSGVTMTTGQSGHGSGDTALATAT